ncbi:MAG: sugar ABC transporter ATP-binding protein [Planctomycetota bacterium]|jgi:ribose transport system ATP-binding protein|nr:sugar ABC transporter ATP-binding protein [Planctomycetota bacterium]MDP7251062.1 sugar ABC transporter ATP-binding protein [Planctomycetota bacterium]
MEEQPLLEVKHVTKRFPGVRALHRVSMHLNRGEVVAVIGENGAGKSTLMKILAGVQEHDEGEILVNGSPARIDSVQKALDLGISLIHQELNLSDNLDVGANIFLGREPMKFGLIDTRKIYAESRKFLDKVGLDCQASTIVGELPIGRQQLVEIAKALSVNARVLIMDEPTSSLSERETEYLFRVVKDLRDQGVSIVYISHRLGEVKELADRVVVLRDGDNAGDLGSDEISHDNMVSLMVGRDISEFYHHRDHRPGAPVLEVEDLIVPEWPMHKLSFKVHAGEIVGLAGLVGAGRTEMLKALFGVNHPLGGKVIINGEEVTPKNAREAMDAGMALVPENRKEEGLFLEMTVTENISLPGLEDNCKSGVFIDSDQERSVTDEMIRKLNIRTPGPDQELQYLSGGNQQKVVLGKWLSLEPGLLLLDEPTRGIDVGAKEEIYALIEDLAERGMAILFVSSEMEEILGLSDRAIVMHEGRITGGLSREQLSEETVMHLATGNIEAA